MRWQGVFCFCQI
ncbi:hypothetical protein Pint_22957 [Pistacia integerrima]|uniref:Uncharacterized protein n=1 Tax=Pistacia integerrima TaxID=434235 RepID=A0ACC0YLU3_9ROSI|nr:hypothetical protein Pint_22957 [Pistacia integerrima]